MSSGTKEWYILRVVGGKEKKVKVCIDNEISNGLLQDFVGQVLIPMEKYVQIRNGKKVVKEKMFFPGYLLIEAELVGEIPYILKDIPNVIGFLTESKDAKVVATPLRQSEVEKILGTVNEFAEASDTQQLNIFNIADVVKVIDGPFASFYGTVEEIHEDKKKLVVMVKIFGRKTPLELGFMQVEKEQ